MKNVVLLLGIVAFVPSVKGTALHCAEYLQCEAEMMTLHRKCSDRSRNITSETCNLVDEFRDLRALMSMRETEFAICVGYESVREVELNSHIPSFQCNVTVLEPTVIQGCWRSVAVVKRRCQRLKKCCPAANRCMRRLATSDTTALVRRKHVDINRKTLKCRNEMKKIIKMNGNDQSNPIVSRAHAVISARSEAVMDVVGQDKFMKSEDMKAADPFFPKKQSVKTNAKNVTSILKSRYTELARIAEELADILTQKRHRRRQKELLKKYGSGFTSGKKRLLLLHSAKEAKGEKVKIQHLLNSVQNGTEKLEIFTSTTPFPKSKFGRKLKFATVTSSSEVIKSTTTVSTDPTTVFLSASTTTSTLPSTTRRKNVANKFGRPRGTFVPVSEFVPLIDSQTRTTIAPKLKTPRRRPVIKGAELSGALIPNLTAKKMAESKSVEMFSTKSPAELQEYLRKGKGELPKTTKPPAEAYVGEDGAWTLDPPQEEESKKFNGDNNDLIVTHEEGTFPVSPYHRELLGDQENEIRRSGKHGFSKRKYSRIKLRKMVEEMATAEPLFLTSGERPSKDQYGEHSTPHIVEKELIDTTKSSGGLRIPFNLVDDSQQNRVGIFPITTKEPRRIKITMWPPGYRNHFTKRPLSEVQQNTSTTMPPHAASGTLFTPRMPESFYKVFYPQMKPAKRHRLKGYRNKVLFARRHLKRPKGRVAYNYANAITHRAKHVPAAVTKLPIHRLRPKRPDSLLNQITDEHERTNANVVDNAPSPSAFITPAVSSNESSADEDNNIDDLKFQLMIELEGFIQSQHGRLREEMESELQHERLALLRRPRSEYDAAKRRIGYCELFAACADELKSIEHRCKQNNSRLMPGLPKRRFGQCNAELVPEFKKYDELKQQADNAFDQCFVEELVNEALEDRPIQSEDCPSDWPLLPPYEILDSCHEQIRVVQNHCSKLGKCCSSVDKCREQVANLAITDMVSEMKSIIALKSAECQIKTFKEYSRKKLNEPSAKPPNKIQYDNVITEEDLSFLVADQPEGKHKSTGPYVSQRPLRNMSVD